MNLERTGETGRANARGGAGGREGALIDPSSAGLKLRILFTVGGGLLTLDLATKWVVRETFFLGQTMEVAGDFFRLTYILNPGAAFGIHAGDHSRIVFTVLALFVLVLLVAMYRQTPATDRFRLVAIALVCGGAIGNLLNRIASPYGVVDFLDVGVGDLRWPVFNLADIGITVGALLLALSIWKEEADGGDDARPVRDGGAAAGDDSGPCSGQAGGQGGREGDGDPADNGAPLDPEGR